MSTPHTAGSITSYAGVDAPFGFLELGHVFMTELAKETQQLQAQDPLTFALPQRSYATKEVRVEWVEEELRLLGVVRSGQPNRLNTFNKVKGFNFEAAMFRRGDILDMELINFLRAPGTTDQEYGMDLVHERLGSLIQQGNLMWSYLRTQLMTGGINYEDPETGNTIIADPGIPDGNFYTIGAGVMAGSAVWTHKDGSGIYDALIVDDFQDLIYRMKIEGKNPPTHAVMSTAMRKIISANAQVRKFLPGNTTGLYAMGLVSWGKDGQVESICGITIIDHYMLFDANKNGSTVTGNRGYMWPVNVVTFFSVDNPSLPGAKLGYTALTKGEHPFGGTGIWCRTADVSDLKDPTLPPGFSMQVGMAGIPVLYKPWWVHVVTVCTESEVTDLVGTRYITT